MKFRINDIRIKQLVVLSDILPDVIDDLDLEDTFILESIRNKWSIYVGNILSSHSFPENIYNKTLSIHVDHSAYAGELSIHSENILLKIRNDFGYDVIKFMKFNIKRNRWKKDNVYSSRK